MQVGIRRDAMEVERLGAYNPNRQYSAPPWRPIQRPPVQQAYSFRPPAQQQYAPRPPVQQQYAPRPPVQPQYSPRPPVQQQYAPGPVERIGPAPQTMNRPVPPPVPVPVPVSPPVSQAPAPPVQQDTSVKTEEDSETKKYVSTGRRPAIILSLAAFVLTVIALFALPLDFSSFDTTLLRIGMLDGQTVVLATTIITMVLAVVAILLPMVSVLSGLCMMVTAIMAYGVEGLFDFPTGPGCAVFVMLATYIIGCGIVSTLFMKKFITSNLDDVPILKACYLTWTGIPHL